jgi:lysozyme
VSKWQHPELSPEESPESSLDWTSLSGSYDGFRFAFIKASEGAGTLGDINPWYAQDLAAAKATGAHVGAYHYAGPGLPVTEDALAEAQHAVESAGQPGVGDLPLVLDMESNPDGLTPEQMSEWALTWLEEVNRLTGRTPIFYTYPTFFATDMAPDPKLGEYPLWIANYGLAVTEPAVPAPWTTWTFWQHSAEGELPGTFGYVDLNVFAGTEAELALLAGITYSGKGVDVSGVSLMGDAMLAALTDSSTDAPTSDTGAVSPTSEQ